MDLMESLLKIMLAVVYTESVPFILYSHGSTYEQTFIISHLVMALKLVLDVFVIRVVLRRLSIWWRRYVWRRLRIFFSNQKILSIKELPSTNTRKIEIVAWFGRLKIIYQKPIRAMGRLRDKLVKWAIGVGTLAVFILAVLPTPPIIAAAAVLAYIALTIKRPWYQFNNWFFFAMFLGSEIKVGYIVLGLYGIKIF